MNKLFTKIASAFVGIAMAVGVGVALGVDRKAEAVSATDVTINASEFTAATSTAIDETISSIKFEISNGTTTTEVRIFKGATIKISAPANNVLTSVVFNCTANGTTKYGPGCFAAYAGYSYSGKVGTWTGSSESIQLTAESNQVRVTSFVVSYESSSTDTPEISLNPSSLSFVTTDTGKTVTVTPNDVFEGTPTISVEGTPSYVTSSVNGLVVTFTPKAIGKETVTIKAVYNSQSATATLNVEVIDSHGHTPDDPFSVADVISLIDEDKTKTHSGVYVAGIICQIDSFNSSFGSITYWISDDGTTNTKFEVYGGLGIDSAKFSSKEDIEVGATVVLCGDAKYYAKDSVYEFDKNNYQVSYNAPSKALSSIELSGTYKTSFEVGDTFDHEGLVVTAHYDNGTTKDVSESVSFSGFDSTEVVASQTITVSYTEGEVTKTATYNVEIKAVTVKHTISFNNGGHGTGTMDDVIVSDGDDYQLPANGYTPDAGWKFDSWSVGGTRRQPGYVVENITEDMVFIAMWEEYAVATYKKVETKLLDYSGEYLLVYEGDATHQAVAFNGSLTTLDAASNGVAVEINNDKILLSEIYSFTVAKKEGGYSIKSASGLYIGKTAYANGLDSDATDKYTNGISYSLDDGLVISGEGTSATAGPVTLRYNYNSDQLRYRFYKSGQQAISLYMRVDPAEELGLELLNKTYSDCEAYVDGTSDYEEYKGKMETIWSDLSTMYDNIEDPSKLVSTSAKEDGTMLEEAMARYDFLTVKYQLDNFITGRKPAGAVAPVIAPNKNSDTAIIIVTIIAITSVSAIGALLVIKRRKSITK